MGRLGSLGAILGSKPTLLRRHLRAHPEAATLIRACRSIMHSALREPVAAQPVFPNQAVLDPYLRSTLGHEKREQFRVLFLNRQYRLLADEVLWRGTIDQVATYPREIVEQALERGASGLILVHNHPSGDPRPSDEDISLTRLIVRACKALDIRVHDHLIVAGHQIVSLKALQVF
jgi:DNA repair protein RadC